MAKRLQPENAITRAVKKEVKKKVRKLRGYSQSESDTDDEFDDGLVRIQRDVIVPCSQIIGLNKKRCERWIVGEMEGGMVYALMEVKRHK